MDFLEQRLYDNVTTELYVMALKCQYPIHPAIGLWGFFEAFRNQGIIVANNEKEKSASFNLLTAMDGFKMVTAKTGHDSILNGWKNHPKSSLNSLYDSICEVYDLMGKRIKDDEDRNKWAYFRDTQSREVNKKMQEIIRPYFARHQEHMLVPVYGKLPELKKPILFEKVLEDFPMDMLKNARLSDFHNDRIGYHQCHEFADETSIEEFYEGQNLSEAEMTDYFVGKYLLALSKEKGYIIEENERALECLTIWGSDALKDGQQMIWNI
jgi:hypothetical protein